MSKRKGHEHLSNEKKRGKKKERLCRGRWNGVYESINEGIWQKMDCPDPAKPLKHDVM